MSNEIPKYQPSLAYHQATIDLAYGVVDEIHSYAQTTPSVLANWQWYQHQIEPLDTRIRQLRKDNPLFEENLVLKTRMASLQAKFQETVNFLIENHLVAFHGKWHKFHTCLSERSNLELATHRSKIATFIAAANTSVQEYNEEPELEGIKNIALIEKIQNLITMCSQTIEWRLKGYDHKDDGSPAPSSDFLKPFLEKNTDKTPHYRPRKAYFLCRAGYRMVRIKEYSIWLNKQKDSTAYREMFIESLKQESSRINALERASKRAGKAIPEQIAECRVALKELWEESQKKLS